MNCVYGHRHNSNFRFLSEAQFLIRAFSDQKSCALFRHFLSPKSAQKSAQTLFKGAQTLLVRNPGPLCSGDHNEYTEAGSKPFSLKTSQIQETNSKHSIIKKLSQNTQLSRNSLNSFNFVLFFVLSSDFFNKSFKLFEKFFFPIILSLISFFSKLINLVLKKFSNKLNK